MEDDFNFLKFRNHFIFENKHHKHEGPDVGILLNSNISSFPAAEILFLCKNISNGYSLKTHETSIHQSL